MNGVTPALPAQLRLIEAIHDLLAAVVKSISHLNFALLAENPAAFEMSAAVDASRRVGRVAEKET
jgi:hypothetical protein